LLEGNNTSLYNVVSAAAYRLQYGGLAPNEDGAWTMWGGPGPGSVYFTTYALYFLASLGNSTIPSYAELVNHTLVENGAVWLAEQQEDEGYWIGRGSDYLRSKNTLTAWALRALILSKPYASPANQATIQNSIDKAIAYIVSSQNSDGGWGDVNENETGWRWWSEHKRSNAYTTGLILYDLVISGNTSTAVENAKQDAVHWLTTYGNNNETRSQFLPISRDVASHSYSYIGSFTEATAYALMGLNATGLADTSTSIFLGRSYLLDIYQSDGSWGYTKSSAAAIAALT